MILSAWKHTEKNRLSTSLNVSDFVQMVVHYYKKQSPKSFVGVWLIILNLATCKLLLPSWKSLYC